MNKSLNVRLTLHARKVLEGLHSNPVGPSAAICASKMTSKAYQFKLPGTQAAIGWLKKNIRRAK